MFGSALETIRHLIDRGGPVMWPLLACSLAALTLIFERCWFWIAAGLAWRRRGYGHLGRALRDGRWSAVRDAVGNDRSVYGSLLRRIVQDGPSDAVATEAIEEQKIRMERFTSILSTIITAAPMLGILGTVSGIISAFKVLSQESLQDPSKVAGGIGEALLTTIFGLSIAICVLFPYNAFRVYIDRALGRMETLVTAAQAGGEAGGDEDETPLERVVKAGNVK